MILPQIGYHAFSSEPREVTSFERANLPAVSPSAPRIVWILMDELSYDQAFPSRQADVLLPNFDALSTSSIVFSEVRSAGVMTEKVLPTLFLGKSVVELRKPYPGPPSYRSVAQGPWQQFNQYDANASRMEYCGQTTGPFFSGNGSRFIERAWPIRFIKSSRVPTTTAGLHPIPSSRRIKFFLSHLVKGDISPARVRR